MSAAVFIVVIVYPPTLQFVTISFFLKNARAYCTFYIYLATPLSQVHVSNNRSNTDYDPQGILLHCRIRKLKLSETFRRITLNPCCLTLG